MLQKVETLGSKKQAGFRSEQSSELYRELGHIKLRQVNTRCYDMTSGRMLGSIGVVRLQTASDQPGVAGGDSEQMGEHHQRAAWRRQAAGQLDGNQTTEPDESVLAHTEDQKLPEQSVPVEGRQEPVGDDRMLEQWTPEWSNPVFSSNERDRRWKLVRDFMARDGIDIVVCLPCTNNHDRGQQDARYLTQLGENSDEVTVFFSLSGEFTAWSSRGGVWPGSNWFSDIRAGSRGSGGKHIVDRLKESAFVQGTIGIAGLSGGVLSRVRAGEGEVSWQSVEMIKSAFPKAKIVSATDLLGEARLVKSEEEIEFIRKATEVAERTMEAVLEHGRAGVAERDLFGRMMYANAAAGGSFPPMLGWISGPLGNTYHRLEQPSFRRLAEGDVLITEIEGRWAGYAAQVDQAFSIGAAHRDLQDGMKLAWEAYDRAFEALRPGTTVAELMKVTEVRGMNGRGIASLTMHGRGTGDDGPLITGRGASQAVLDLEIRENCSMLIKPSTSVDGKPDYGRWGETVVVRKHGAERLGTRKQELYELS